MGEDGENASHKETTIPASLKEDDSKPKADGVSTEEPVLVEEEEHVAEMAPIPVVSTGDVADLSSKKNKKANGVESAKQTQTAVGSGQNELEGSQPRRSKKGGKKKKGSALQTAKDVGNKPELQRIKELEEMLERREDQLKRQAELLNEAQSVSDAADEGNKNAQRMQQKLEEAEKQIKSLVDEKKSLEGKAKMAGSLQQQLKAKDAEIQEIMQEGEGLSKKQLQMETLIKQLRNEVSSLQEEVAQQNSTIEVDKSRIISLEKAKGDLESIVESSKENQDGLIEHLKSEHAKTIKELRAELIAAERKMESMEKAGASRKLRDAESKCEALQNSMESIREEMRRQRQNADEREDMLSAEISMLQEKCSEAEVRQQDFENKLKQATSPLLAEIDTLRIKLEEQDQRSIASEKRFMDQIASLEAEKQDMVTKIEYLRESEEEARVRCDGLQSQLISAQQSSVESERIASEAKSARDKAEVLLREAKSELAAIEKSSQSTEKLFYSQLEAMTSKESALKETIRGLEDNARVLTQKLEEAQSRASNGPHVDAPATRLDDFSTLIDESEDGVRRKIKDLEIMRDQLSNELVKAEQRLAEGHAAKVLLDSQTAEISDLRKKLAAATELLGEREERIEELRADLQDMREGYKQQLVIMADEVSRLTKKERVVEELLSQ